MSPRVFWSLAVLGLASVLLLGAWWFYTPPPALPPMPPDVKAKETKSVPPAPTPPGPTPGPASAPAPSDPVLRRWQEAVRGRNQKGVLASQDDFLRREDEMREPLVAMAKDDPDPRIRAFTVAVLGRMKSPPPESFFIGRLSEAHEYPRTSSLQALEKIGTAACLAEVDRLAADPSEAVRQAAAQAAKAVRSR